MLFLLFFADLLLKPIFCRRVRHIRRVLSAEACVTITLSRRISDEHIQMVDIEISQAVRTDDLSDFFNRVFACDQILLGVNICTVVGFPLGYSVTEAKVAEVRKALEDGCNEIDMVVNISDVKNGLLDKVEEEIRTLKKECGHHILKVIIETCYLTEEEKIAMCKAVTNAGADFIKTSTGFGTGGATKEDVELFKKYIGPNVKIKAAGGVSSMEDLEMFLGLGCERIGTSRAVGLCKGELTEGY